MRHRRQFQLLVVFLLALSSPVFAADTVSGLVEAFDNASLGEAVTVGNLVFQVGHFELRLESGTASPVKAGERTLGLFLAGKGTWVYRSVDPVERPVVSYNAKKSTDLKVDASGEALVLQDTFTEARIWAANVALPKAEGAPAPAPAATWEKHRDLFAREYGSQSSFLFVRDAVDALGQPLVRIEMSGGQENAVYVHDPIERRSESLYTLFRERTIENRELARQLFSVPISDQPIGRTRKDFLEPAFLLTAIDYSLVADGNDAKLSITETLQPRLVAQSVFRFDLYNKSYGSASDVRKHRVTSVKDEQGKELSFHHEKNQILVGLGRKVPAGQSAKLRFEIEGDFLIRPDGDSFWQLGTEPWFPQPELNGQFYTIHSEVKVKKPWKAFAPGKTTFRGEEGDYAVVRNVIDKPVQFAVVHAGKYAMSEETQDGVTIRVATYAGANDVAMKKLSNLAFKIIAFYQPFLGPFPFSEFNIIEINSFGYGQAPPATMFITKEAFNPLQGDVNQVFSKGINHRFAHEIAHQYWGHVVKMSSVEEQWLTESFAEYSSSLVVRQIKGKSGYDSMVATWKSNAKDATKVAPIPLANRISTPGDYSSAFLHRTHLLYDKGAYFLAMLAKQVGEETMLTFLRNYQGLYAWKFGMTKDVEGLLEHMTKKELTPYFDENFWGTSMP